MTSLSPERRVIVVVNPNSSRKDSIDTSVLTPLLDSGVTFDMLHTTSPNAEDNIDDIAHKIRAGDRLLVASGDGVIHQAANAILASGLDDISLAAEEAGNFNDFAKTFTDTKKHPATLLKDDAEVVDVHPLEIHINDELYRYAILYSTIGYTAMIAAMMDDPELRSAVQKSKFKIPRTLLAVGKKYLQHPKSPLPDFKREDRESDDTSRITDVLSINGPNMARYLRSGHDYFRGKTFLQADLDVANLAKSTPFLARSAFNLIAGRHISLPGNIVAADTLHFNDATIGMQQEGEVSIHTNVSSVRTAKSDRVLKVVTNRG